MPKVTDEYLIDKKNFILECTGEILKETPLYLITMRDIIKKAGFSQGAIYRYYTNLDEIYVDFMNKHTTNILLEQKIDVLLSSEQTEKMNLAECLITMGKYIEELVTFPEILKSLFVFKEYTVSEKINWFLGADFSMIYLFPTVLKDNLFISSVKFQVPFYIIQGDYDYMVSQVLAEKYLAVLEAPEKEFFTFAHSAHSPNMEEPEAFIEVFRKITSNRFPLVTNQDS